jgi:spore coat protein U-like protein
MNLGWLLRVVVLLALAGSVQAQTFSCRFRAAPPNYTQVYSSLANSSTALSVQVRCGKAGGGAGKTINYTVTPSNGLNASGSQNRASFSGQFINYDFYTDSACTIPWSGSGTIVLPGGGGSNQTQTLNYYGCVPASQPVLPAAGTYADTVTMTLAVPDPAVTITGANPRSFTVGVTVNATCTLSTPPGSVNFGTYTAFQGSASTANTTFRTTCTTSTPYTMSLDTTGGVVSGLNYSLLLNTTGSGGTHPLGPVSGTGVPQTFYINGTMPANQAGTCPTGICAGTNTHTLTISY